MRAEVKVLAVVVVAAVLAYVLSQPAVLCTTPIKLTHIKNITVVTVADGTKLYTLTVNGSLNDSKMCVVFYRGTPTKVVQDKRVYDVISWSVRSTVEKMPEVKP